MALFGSNVSVSRPNKYYIGIYSTLLLGLPQVFRHSTVSTLKAVFWNFLRVLSPAKVKCKCIQASGSFDFRICVEFALRSATDEELARSKSMQIHTNWWPDET